MKPLTSLERTEAKGLSGVLFDLDDTFLDDGVLTERAYASLWRLSRAGLRLLAVTGRPAGFGEVMARQWPVDAVVTENGAVALFRREGKMVRWQAADESTQNERRARISRAFAALGQRFPLARLSDDSHARRSDLALDIGESQRVPARVVAEMEAEARRLGLRTFVSSVHLHLTLEPFDKASGTLAFLAHHFHEDPTRARRRYAYIGDSANDAACFFAFATSIGVANVTMSLPRLSVPPRYVASLAGGAGFAEIADHILRLRS